MAKSEEIIKKKNFYYWMGKISDILIYPIIIIALITSFSMFSAKMENKVTMIFNHSIVKILSGSMVASGFEVGQSVIIKRVDTDKLRVGDVVSFYYYKDAHDDIYEQRLITDFDNLPFEDSDEIDYTNRKTRSDAERANSKVYFHQIISIKINSEGIRYFQTKGTSNQTAETNLTREDFVVGKYINTPVWLREVFKFFSSAMGMIILVIVPLTILICMQLLSLLEQISALMLEKKVLQGKVDYDSEECMSSNVAIEMRTFDKVYLYDIVEKEKQNDLHRYLWSYLKTKRNKFQKDIYKVATTAEELYNASRKAYWVYWITHTNKYLSKNIIKMQARADKLKYLQENGLIVQEKAKIKKRKKWF